MKHNPSMERSTCQSGGLSDSQAREPEPTAIADVAGAVAHEVANAVSAIAGWAELGLEGATDPREALALIARCARTAEHAARRMLRVSRGDTSDEPLVLLDVSELSRELIQLLSITARQARVQLKPSIEPSLGLRATQGHWFTLLWNLVKNAIEASPEGASVHITLCGDEVGVDLSVRDEGPGLDEAAQVRIFSPFVTTKSTGTGLGLHLVQEAVEGLGGHIILRSAPGRGATFRVHLPRGNRLSEILAVPPIDAPVVTESEKAPRRGTAIDAHLLVVDDDDALREMLATALSLRGARITTARSAEEAYTRVGPFDAALIDMTLGDIRGDELLAQLRKRGTVSAAMLVTGSAHTPRLVPGGEPDDWFRKPFEVSELVERVQRILDRHQMLKSAVAAVGR